MISIVEYYGEKEKEDVLFYSNSYLFQITRLLTRNTPKIITLRLSRKIQYIFRKNYFRIKLYVVYTVFIDYYLYSAIRCSRKTVETILRTRIFYDRAKKNHYLYLELCFRILEKVAFAREFRIIFQ